MKKLLILFVMLPLLIGVTSPVSATETIDEDITVVSSYVIEPDQDDLCWSLFHKLAFKQGGVTRAWRKLKVFDVCWKFCGVELNTKVKDAYWVDPLVDWYWVVGTKRVGIRACDYTGISRWIYADLHITESSGYYTYQATWLKWTQPLDFHFTWWAEPVEFGQ